MPDPHFASTPAFFKELASGDTPSSGQVSLYAKTDGKMYYKDDTGTETEVGGGGIGGSTGATDNAVLRADGTGGATAQSSGVTISDNGTLQPPIGSASNPSLMPAGKYMGFHWTSADRDIRISQQDSGNCSFRMTETGFVLRSNVPLGWATDPAATSPTMGFLYINTGVLGIYNPSVANTGAILEFYNPVASGGTPSTNSARIYSKDVGGTAEMFVMDEAGNETQISPHAAQHAPDSMVDSAWDEVGYSANYYTGIITWTNRSRETAKLANARGYESFEEYNIRYALTNENAMQMWDWDAVQAEHVLKSIEIHDEWVKRKEKAEADGVEFTEIEPAIIVAKPIPTFLAEQINTRQQFLADRFSRTKLYPDAKKYQVRAWMIRGKIDLNLVPDIITQVVPEVVPEGEINRTEALMRWHDAEMIPRDFPLVNVVGSQMNLTPMQIDAAWADILKI